MGVEDLVQALVFFFFFHSGHSYPQNHLPTRVQILALHKSSVAVRAGNANAGRWGRGGGEPGGGAETGDFLETSLASGLKFQANERSHLK